MSQHMVKPLNITAIGDDYIGKSSLIYVYATKEFPEDMDTNKKLYYLGRCHVVAGDEEFYLTMKAAPGEKYYDDSRIIWHAHTDCFLLCYSISSRDSFTNIERKWFPEIRRHSKSAPILLVGTMSDLRNTEPSDTLIKMSEGQQLAKRIQANGFIECSALDQINVDKVFTEATKAIIVKSNDYEHLPDFEEIIEEQEVTLKKNSPLSSKKVPQPVSQKQSTEESGKNGKVKRSKNLETRADENTTENKTKEEIKTAEQIAKESGKNGKVKKAKKPVDDGAKKKIVSETEEVEEIPAQVDKEHGKSGKAKTAKKTINNEDKKEANGESEMKDKVALAVAKEVLPKSVEAAKKRTYFDRPKIEPKRPQIGELIKQFESENKL